MSTIDKSQAVQDMEVLLQGKFRELQSLLVAIGSLQGLSSPGELAAFARDRMNELTRAHFQADDAKNVVSFRRQDAVASESDRNRPVRAASDTKAAQTFILDLLESMDGEVTIPEIASALSDNGQDISPGHLSVLLTRMVSGDLIRRSARGRYSAA
jgi:hypothetical protein